MGERGCYTCSRQAGVHERSCPDFMPEASRLTPETLRAIVRRHGGFDDYPDGITAHADAWAADLVDSGKRIATEFLGRPIAYWVELDNYAKERNVDKLIGEIERLREQLRAYRGAERIAHDQLEAAE